MLDKPVTHAISSLSIKEFNIEHNKLNVQSINHLAGWSAIKSSILNVNYRFVQGGGWPEGLVSF